MLHVSSPDNWFAGFPLLEPVKLQVPLAKAHRRASDLAALERRASQ